MILNPLQISSVDSKENLIQFRVRDTGIGMTKEQLNKVFERFVQASDETTRVYGGTGLGLSIVYNLTELLQGTIRVNSTVNGGTEFIVNMPLCKSESTSHLGSYADINEQSQLQFSQGLRVLVTEDNKLNQVLAKRVLEKMNCIIEIAENGAVALDKLVKNRYDIILMDIQMPVLDGYLAAARIRKDLKLKTPIVAMTAHVLAGERERCLESGMNDYISKPYSYDQLFMVINQNINQLSHRAA